MMLRMFMFFILMCVLATLFNWVTGIEFQTIEYGYSYLAGAFVSFLLFPIIKDL